MLNDIEKIGVVVECHKHGIYATTYYFWLEKYKSHGIEGLSSIAKKRADKDAKKLQEENDRLKKLLAEKELELKIKAELLKKRCNSGRTKADFQPVHPERYEFR